MKGVELNQNVEPSLARNAEFRFLREQLGMSSKLNRVRSDREIGVATDLEVLGIREDDRRALHSLQSRWRGESGMQSANGKREEWLVSPTHPHPHFAHDDEPVDEARVEQYGIQEGSLLVEIHTAGNVHLQPDKIQILLRQNSQ